MTSLKVIKAVLLPFLSVFLLTGELVAQKTHEVGELLHEIEKLGVAGSVMYIAAHPDDENQQFLSFMANERKMRTAYLSLTRGDGGQNLIGKEQNEAVGLLRSQELLKARSVDGAEQFFTRAIDFGYSKTTEEALRFWNKDSVLFDVVYRIRAFQPDIIVTRFPPDKRAGHGHHSASAVLAMEAYKAAANPAVFPEQLRTLKPWQVKRVYWNFYNRGFTNTPPDDGNFVQLELGTYNPLLGKSYPEIAAKARSQHRSQGFGAAARRGLRTETFKYLIGDKAKKDLLDDVNTSWSRYAGGEMVDALHKELLQSFDVRNPSASIPVLLQIKKALAMLPRGPLVEKRKDDLDQIILGCSGIFIEAIAKKYIYTTSEKLTGRVEFLHQYPENLTIQIQDKKETSVETNELAKIDFEIELGTNASTQPYWLKKERQKAIFNRPIESINLPFDKEIKIPISISFGQETVDINVPIVNRFVEPASGEVYRDIEIRPSISINPVNEAAIWIDNSAKKLVFDVISNRDNTSGTFALQVPKGWRVDPVSLPLKFDHQGDRQRVEVSVVPSKEAKTGYILPLFDDGKSTYNRSLVEILYDHIPNTSYFPVAMVKAIKLEIATKGSTIGYIMGAGDKVPESLQEIGYNVRMLNENDFSFDLSKYDAIVVGIRAYNVHDWLPSKSEALEAYMKKGGRVVVQYQTSRISPETMAAIAPYEMKLGRSRVSEEDVDVKFLAPKHPLLNFPNEITSSDFDGWVQERGLYFAEEWSSEFEPILGMHDKNEDEKQGSLVYAKVGKGSYVYTGISFFRELPAGVEGAFKLLANIVSKK